MSTLKDAVENDRKARKAAEAAKAGIAAARADISALRLALRVVLGYLFLLDSRLEAADEALRAAEPEVPFATCELGHARWWIREFHHKTIALYQGALEVFMRSATMGDAVDEREWKPTDDMVRTMLRGERAIARHLVTEFRREVGELETALADKDEENR